MDRKEFLQHLFLEALECCSPSQAVREALSLEGATLRAECRQYEIADRPIYLWAAGKASLPMMNTAAEILGDRITGSLAIVPAGTEVESCRADEVVAAAHPVPDEKSQEAGERVREFLQAVPKDAIVISLISGGTSSLMCYPAEGIAIDQLSVVFELLNNSGATIREINTVRKHCSQIKGGQLLRALNPGAALIDLVISDVPDDDLATIGSGSTIADLSTFQDAYHILLKYRLWDKLPAAVRAHIEKGIDGQVPETVRPNEDPLDQHDSHVISSARMLVNKVAELATEAGYHVEASDDPYNEDVEQVAQSIAEEVLQQETSSEATVYVYYGESTVDVTGDGKGGRNQELALWGALAIAGQPNISWLSAGTDGIDGPTDAAGAVVDGTTIPKAREQGVEPEAYLAENDSYHFHQQMGTLFKPGATGNNLMDLVLVVVGD